jgi:hypothetical protein
VAVVGVGCYMVVATFFCVVTRVCWYDIVFME